MHIEISFKKKSNNYNREEVCVGKRRRCDLMALTKDECWLEMGNRPSMTTMSPTLELQMKHLWIDTCIIWRFFQVKFVSAFLLFCCHLQPLIHFNAYYALIFFFLSWKLRNILFKNNSNFFLILRVVALPHFGGKNCCYI